MQIQTDRCLLRAWRPDDHDSLILHANNREVARNLRDRFPHPYTNEHAEVWLHNPVHEIEPLTTFAIDTGGDAVGGISLILGSDVERFSAELGYWLGERVWGRGIATTAVIAMTNYAFETLNLERVFALPFAFNDASVRVLEKCGYRREALLRRSAFKDGEFVDQCLYARLRTD